ncbi:MAG: stage II sporulation protein M [Planctomycetota bacterium]
MREFRLKSVEFRRERKDTWRELERLLKVADSGGLRRLTPEELMRLPELYRATASALSVARAISLDRNLLDYLEALTQRAYVVVYAPKRSLVDLAREFLVEGFPRSLRAMRWELLVSALLMIAGAVIAYTQVRADPEHFYSYVDRDLAGGRGPESTREELLAVIYSDVPGSAALGEFSGFLFNHNANIGLMAAALGVLGGVPTAILELQNGLMLGAFVAIHAEKGIAVDIWGWLLIHGVTELLAIVVCGAAGFALARAIAFPGAMRRRDRLRIVGTDVGQVMVGAILMFLVAGLIEGVLRQTIQDRDLRFAFAAASGAFWLWYFVRVGRART